MKDFIKNVEALIKYYEKENDNYTLSVRNKSVALVGPSETILGLEQGKIIDSCDYVARLNTVVNYFPLDPKWHEDIGSRTNIIYTTIHVSHESSETVVQVRASNNGETLGKKFQTNLFNIFLNNEAQFLVVADPGPPLHTQLCQIFQENNINDVSVHRMNFNADSLHPYLKKLTGNPHFCLRTGFQSVVDTFVRGAIVHLFGMTFYHGGGNMFRPKAVYDLGPTTNESGYDDIYHDSTLELQLLRALMDAFPDRFVIYEELDTIW